ncbi:MAG: addiction module protein [Chloroflexi bacterium]|nr:addiction module protein [Chloroflexota bacterium]MBV9602881.1 addiction module protein [Chloroflexota bacterium]
MQLSSDELRRLSVDERLELIGQLWDSLEHEPLPLSDAQQHELDRRLESLESDPAEGVSWEQLRAELERRCP